MTSPMVTQLPGYQDYVHGMNETQRTTWLHGQPGYNDSIQGPPTPFAMSVHRNTPLFGLEQNYIAAINNRNNVLANPNSTAEQINQANRSHFVAKIAYTSRTEVIEQQEANDRALLRKVVEPYRYEQDR